MRTVIDLRRPREVARDGRVPEFAGLAYHHLHPEHAEWEDAADHDEPSDARWLANRYLDLAYGGAAAMVAAVAVIAEADNAPVVVHCVAGKDRTGVVAALTLAALGVAEQDIAEDYALTAAATGRFTEHLRRANPEMAMLPSATWRPRRGDAAVPRRPAPAARLRPRLPAGDGPVRGAPRGAGRAPAGGPRVRVCVVGAGAVGGVLGVRLAAAGLPVSVLARGATLAAIRSSGWRLRQVNDQGTPDRTMRVTASDDPARLGPQDLVFLTVKAHSLPDLAPSLAPLLGPDTVVVAALNGVPWWFLHPRRLHSVDPTGSIAASIPSSAVLGCVVHLSASVTSPGVVALRAENELILGAPGGGPDERSPRRPGRCAAPGSPCGSRPTSKPTSGTSCGAT